MPDPTILVVGSGNAGFCAALSAAESGIPGSSILLIDKCPEDWAGGNSYFTAGAFRATHDGLTDILPIVNNVDAQTAAHIDLPAYTESEFLSDLKRVTEGRSSPDLGAVLVGESNAAVKWLHALGVRFQLSFNRQAYRVNGRFKFWGGLCLKTQDGGKGLISDLSAAAKQRGIRVHFSTALTSITTDPSTGRITGARVQHATGREDALSCTALVLAAGGFEANPRLRAQYLGPGWDLAHVRGTPYNTGECLSLCLDALHARSAGHWSGCHSVAWDAASPPASGNRSVSNEFTKSGYPLGVMLNAHGRRFVDEGIDFRNFTYAKFGRAILEQDGGVAFQVWDKKGAGMLREEEYRADVVERITADSIDELAAKCAAKGLQSEERFVETIRAFNEAVYAFREENPEVVFDPAVKDGLGTRFAKRGLEIPKSNWARALDEPPFLAVKVTCGITFTFGGLAVRPDTAGVVSETTGREVEGLFCAGEMVGGLFYGNYPGGSGLTSGTVFGRRAGRAAAELVKRSGEGGKGTTQAKI